MLLEIDNLIIIGVFDTPAAPDQVKYLYVNIRYVDFSCSHVAIYHYDAVNDNRSGELQSLNIMYGIMYLCNEYRLPKETFCSY